MDTDEESPSATRLDERQESLLAQMPSRVEMSSASAIGVIVVGRRWLQLQHSGSALVHAAYRFLRTQGMDQLGPR